MDAPTPTDLHAAARRRAHQLRDAAVADAFHALATWLRRALHKKVPPCRS